MKIAAIALLLALTGVSQEKPCDPAPAAVVDLGSHNFPSLQFPASPEESLFSGALTGAKVKWVRAQLRLDSAASSPWRVEVRDQQFRPIDVLSDADFRLSNIRWTQRIYTPGFYLDLRSGAPPLPSFTVLQYITMPDKPVGTYYSKKKDTPDWENIDNRQVKSENLPILRAADTVGFFFSDVPEVGAWSCSGVLVAPGLFLTNWHCGGPPHSRDQDLWSSETLQDSFIDLSWDGDQVSRELRVVKVESKSKSLDYALLRVESLDRRPLPEPAHIRLAPLTAAQDLSIIHHPAAAKKALSTCQVRNLEWPGWVDNTKNTEITYPCDTEDGSSGAPVLAGGAVVALHHLGYSRGAGCASDNLNKAVLLRDIVNALSQNLRSEMTILP